MGIVGGLWDEDSATLISRLRVIVTIDARNIPSATDQIHARKDRKHILGHYLSPWKDLYPQVGLQLPALSHSDVHDDQATGGLDRDNSAVRLVRKVQQNRIEVLNILHLRSSR